eukprot:40003-Eustigmatos_ZCMA.PRE.1
MNTRFKLNARMMVTTIRVDDAAGMDCGEMCGLRTGCVHCWAPFSVEVSPAYAFHACTYIVCTAEQ